MTRPVVPIESTTDGSAVLKRKDTHPAFGTIGVSRVTGSSRLFQSEVDTHGHIIIRVNRAVRYRDWVHPAGGLPLIEVALSFAQFAEMIGTPNTSSGVPCTLRYTEDGEVPGLPEDNRSAETLNEVRDKARAGVAKVAAAAAAVRESFGGKVPGKVAAALRDLEREIGHLPSSMEFAEQSLIEHSETVVSRAKVEVAAFIDMALHRAGSAALADAPHHLTAELAAVSSDQ